MKFLSKGPGETFRCGAELGRRLRRGDTVCLLGELGAGKTTFVKGLATSLGIPEREITSASFTIISEYEGVLGEEHVPLYHVDLYRIGGAGELDSLGIYEYIGGEGISVIEWAERLGNVEGSIRVKFTILGEETREIVIEGRDGQDRDSL